MADEGGRTSGAAAAVLVVVLLGALAFFVMLARESAAQRERDLTAAKVVVPLGEAFVRPLGAERFAMRVTLEVNPARTDRDAVRRGIEARRESLRSMVNVEILGRRRDEELRGPAVVETLRLEIRDRVNRELAAAGLGASAVTGILFDGLEVPPAVR